MAFLEVLYEAVLVLGLGLVFFLLQLCEFLLPLCEFTHSSRTSDGELCEFLREEDVILNEGVLPPQAAIRKHIHPHCKTDTDAINFSKERDQIYETEVNTVFKVNPWRGDFNEVRRNEETIVMSRNKCRYWKCRKINESLWRVTERGQMYAVFRKSDGHLLIEWCRDKKTELDNRSTETHLPRN